MTGTVHFDVPDTNHTSRLGRPSLLRPVSMEEADNSVNEIHESLPRKAAVRLYRQISSGFNSRTIRCILVVSLGLNLIFAVLLGIFVGFWQSSRELDSVAVGRQGLGGGGGGAMSGRGGTTASKNQPYSCFLCSQDGVPRGLTIAVRSRNGVCCTTDSVPGMEQSNKFRELATDYLEAHCPRPTGSGGDGQVRERPSAAHLTLDVAKSKQNLQLPDGHHYLSWNVRDEAGVSFISADLRYVNGTITIPSAGRYHVYTHLTFDTNSNQLPLTQLVVNHSITRISRGGPVDLLMDRVNLFERRIQSSDLEGTFEFRKGDVIKVVVSYPGYLYNMPEANVFGLFKLVSG